MKIQTPILLLAALCAAALFATSTHATVTNIAWYRLGENDPGAASGVTATNTTDLLGLNHLKQVGSPRYTNAVSVGAANGLGSSLAVNFNGTNQCFTNAIVSALTNNFGIEAWVKPNSTNNSPYIVENGSALSGGSWGIEQVLNTYAGTVSGGGIVSFVGDFKPIASPGEWAHLALVRANGTNRFYVNGVTNGPPTTNAPSQPVVGFAIGARGGGDFAFFNGTVDEVRAFTFAPGQFSTNDLLLRRVATLPATGVNPPNATLNGSAHPLGFPTTAWFEWGATTNYGNVTPTQSLGSGMSSTNFSQVLNGIDAGVTYHYRAVASNNLGLAFGTDQSFTKPVFSNTGFVLPGLGGIQGAAWGDFDNDGLLDILLAGAGAGVWHNTGSGFTNINVGLPQDSFVSAAWGDFDNDGRLDILLTGVTPIGNNFQVWRNTGSGFTTIANLPGAYDASVAWGDYDNDGRLDILLTGTADDAGTNHISQVWRNTGSGFIDVRTGLRGAALGSAAWGDYDNDGRLDILLTGNNEGAIFSQVWRNTGSGFTNINAGLPGVFYSSVAWGDYDNDGRLDILIAGQTNGSGIGRISQVWRNTGSAFTNINAGLPGVTRSSVAWGDFDNDGRLDILLTGTTNLDETGGISQVWRNTGSGFTNINAGLPGVSSSSVAWGDYDNDGRLDILIAGQTASDQSISQVWRNNSPNTNTPPSAPSGLNFTLAGVTATFTWNAASDAQTPASGLTYNLRVGTTPGGGEIVGPMAALTGLRRLPQLGNAQMVNFRRETVPAGQPVYWSVQAVDTAFAGSPFAPEQSFTFASVLTPTNGIPVLGDADGNGIVSQSELDSLLTNYFPYSPFLYMTNVAGVGSTNVTFALTNSLAGAFSVEYTTNLVDWYLLGPATPRYEFTDTNAPALPQRYYRLRWP